MAKLTRYLQKIFANNSNQVGVFGTGVDKETSKNVETLQSADYENGWSSAIITNKNYPIWQEMDGVDYGFSYQLAYLMQTGMPEWLSTETYYANTSFCQYGGKIYQSLQDNNTNHNPALNDGYWKEFTSGGASRNIGEIVTSTIPLTDAGLHLLDGTLISGSGSYADFVEYIGDLYDSGDYPDLFCTEADWQTSVTQYGVCGKFVYDSVNNTVRLPKITGIIEGTTDLTALGDLVEAGLPNITGYAHLWGAATDGWSGAFFNSGDDNGTVGGGSSTKSRINFDASLSNSVYGNSPTVQPQTILGLIYIVIANSTKTQIQVDIDEIATDLNGKADVDLTNCTTLATVHCVVETYVNGHSWYRLYDDGWCDQGGNIQSDNTVTFLKPFANVNYNVVATLVSGSTSNFEPIIIESQTTTSMFINNAYSRWVDWRASGYIA